MLPIFTFEKIADTRSAVTPNPAVVVNPTERKPLRKGSGYMRSPSIKDALAGKSEKENISAIERHEAYTQVGEAKDFTLEVLGQKWNQFLLRLEDRPNLQSTLSKIPRLEEDYKLILEIDNSVQDDLINSIKPELVTWLRKELKNSNIQLITQITETEKEKIIYSDSEKYLEMLKLNPNLELLKQKFKLDFE